VTLYARQSHTSSIYISDPRWYTGVQEEGGAAQVPGKGMYDPEGFRTGRGAALSSL